MNKKPRERKAQPKDSTVMSLRIPIELKNQLAEMGVRDGRSTNSEIVHLLEMAVSGSGNGPNASERVWEMETELRELKSTISNLVDGLSTFVEQSIEEAESVHPEIYDFFPDDLDQAKTKEQIERLKRKQRLIKKF